MALTAARGRGKSAALGLAIAGALALGYSNIFVTAPSPENLRTLFEFVFTGLDELDYKVGVGALFMPILSCLYTAVCLCRAVCSWDCSLHSQTSWTTRWEWAFSLFLLLCYNLLVCKPFVSGAVPLIAMLSCCLGWFRLCGLQGHSRQRVHRAGWSRTVPLTPAVRPSQQLRTTEAQPNIQPTELLYTT